MGLFSSDPQWTAADIPQADPALKDRTVIVTGGNVGLGYECARQLALNRAAKKIVLACRSEERGNAAVEKLDNELKDNSVTDVEVCTMKLDLSDLDSVRQFAQKFQTENDRLDVLMNNAGVLNPPEKTLIKGDLCELQLGTNHIGHFLLVKGLLPLMLKTAEKNGNADASQQKTSAKPRIVNVSSNAQKLATPERFAAMLEDPKYDAEYNGRWAYHNSKIANLYFTYGLIKQLKVRKLADKIDVVAVQPGLSATDIGKHYSWWLRAIVNRLAMQTPQGALSQVRAMVDIEGVKNGEYFGPHAYWNNIGYPVLEEPSPLARDVENATKLWILSEKIVGERFFD